MTGLASLLDDMGIKYHANGGERRWPTRSIPSRGFVVDANRGEMQMEEKKVGKALGMRQGLFSLHSG